jgi:ribosomal protein L44E
MTQHFTRNTVSMSLWCKKCQKYTQHRIDGVRKGPCLDCIARLTVEHAQLEIEKRREARQATLFAEMRP